MEFCIRRFIMKSPKLHRILSLALALCVLCTMLSGLSMTAFAVETYTVTYSTPDGVATPAAKTVNAGEAYTLPAGLSAPSSVSGYVFAGWYSSPILIEQESLSVLKGSYTPTGNITLYACYERREVIESAYFSKTDNTPPTGGNDYLVVYESADKNIALCKRAGQTGSSDASYNGNNNYTDVTIDDNGRIAATSEMTAIALRMRNIDIEGHKFSIRVPSGKYFGHSGKDNADIKLYPNENGDNSYANYIGFDSSGHVIIAETNYDASLTPNTTDRVLSYSSRYDTIKYYKNGTNLYLYEFHDTTYKSYYITEFSDCSHAETELIGYVAATCTADGYTGDWVCKSCGEVITQGVTKAALGHDYGNFTSNNNGTHSKTCSRCQDVVTQDCTYTTATVGSTTTHTCDVCGYSYQTSNGCSHNFVNNECTICGEMLRIRGATLSLNNQIDVVYIAVIPSGFTDVSLNVNGTVITEYETDGENSCFYYTGLNPQCMGDNLSATLTGTYNGQTYTATQAVYSVRQYCVNQLKNENISLELRKLVTALLRYGAYAQYFTGYKTNAYVTSGSDIVNPVTTEFTELSGYNGGAEGVVDANTYWLSRTLLLNNGVAMRFRFYASDLNQLTVEVDKNGDITTYTAADFVAVEGETNVYEVTFDTIRPDEYGVTAMINFVRDNDQVGNTLYYSVNAYIQAMQNDSNAKIRSLVRGLSVYGRCLEAYVASIAD